MVTATQMLKVAQDTLGNATVSTRNVNNDNTGSINRVDLMMAQLVTILGKCNEETLKTNMELAKVNSQQNRLNWQRKLRNQIKSQKTKRMHKILVFLAK